MLTCRTCGGTPSASPPLLAHSRLCTPGTQRLLGFHLCPCSLWLGVPRSSSPSPLHVVFSLSRCSIHMHRESTLTLSSVAHAGIHHLHFQVILLTRMRQNNTKTTQNYTLCLAQSTACMCAVLGVVCASSPGRGQGQREVTAGWTQGRETSSHQCTAPRLLLLQLLCDVIAWG